MKSGTLKSRMTPNDVAAAASLPQREGYPHEARN